MRTPHEQIVETVLHIG